jgi:hypothetical protein
VKRAIVGHEDAEHGGEHKPIKVKSGGAVKGKRPEHRPDKRARRADGGHIPERNGVATVDRRYEAEGIDQPHGPRHRRADGGELGHMSGMPKPHGSGKHGGAKNVTVIVGKGDDQGQAMQAHQAGVQQGMQLGARAAAAKMAAPAGGPPRPPMPPPGGAPMPGGPAMAGGPPMMGAPGAARPPMAPPPQMARAGGMIRDGKGRFLGGTV